MYLLVCATELEWQPLLPLIRSRRDVCSLVSGVGPVETAVNLTKYLAAANEPPAGVIHFGVTGAFVGSGVDLLDICVAEREILGDLGVCYGDRIEGFDDPAIAPATFFDLDRLLLDACCRHLERAGTPYRRGNFVTVSCVSGTEERGRHLRDRHRALCENMEGAAVARVCGAFELACLEIRCVSNLVEDRDPRRWKLREAAQKCAAAVARLLEDLQP